jgi:hypothetical protein
MPFKHLLLSLLGAIVVAALAVRSVMPQEQVAVRDVLALVPRGGGFVRLHV